MTWKCHVCKRERPDERISVFKSDISKEHNLPIGTMTQNVRYCNDRPSCIEGARGFRFTKQKEKV